MALLQSQSNIFAVAIKRQANVPTLFLSCGTVQKLVNYMCFYAGMKLIELLKTKLTILMNAAANLSIHETQRVEAEKLFQVRILFIYFDVNSSLRV